MTDALPRSPAAETGDAPQPAGAPAGKPAKKEDGFFSFLIKLVAIVLAVRILAFAPFSIPSESMLPRLMNGDFLLASKWNYGFSNNSLPFGLRPFPEGRIFASQPERGDVVIFKAPPNGKDDYIKRVIGLPGDQVQMIGGVVYLNGIPVKKERLPDFEIPTSPNTGCYSSLFGAMEGGKRVCRYPRYLETLPNGVQYEVLDFGERAQDDTPAVLVPDGMMFLMGDNRDNSLDSRFPPVPGAGIGLVPQNNLVGKASVTMWSTDGSAEWFKPWTWFSAARWSRIGEGF